MATAVHSTTARTSPASRRTTGSTPARPSPGRGANPALLASLGDSAGRIDVMRQVNATAGNAAAAQLAIAARPAVQREDTTGGNEEEDAFVPPERPAFELSNARFTSHKRLADIADGGEPLGRSDPKAVVKAVQTALLDTGYSLLRFKDDGSFGDETAQAITQFRLDNGLGGEGGLDRAALQALDTIAPAPGVQDEHYLDYARLFADGKLDVTLAVGYDETQTHFRDLDSARTWMTAQKLKKDAPPAPEPKPPAPGEPDIITGADTKPPDANESTRKGLSVAETWKGSRSVTYPDATGNRVTKDIAVSITLVPPGTGAKNAFAKGLNDSEVTLYSGHARRGIGPDFDKDKSPYENFIVGVGSALHKAGRVTAAGAAAESHYVIDKKNDLEAMRANWDAEKYRVWMFNACSSIAYFDELRGGLLPEKMDTHNLDLFGTNQAVPIAAGLAPIFANLEGILNAETMEQIVRNMQTATLAAMRVALDEAGYSEKDKARAMADYAKNMFEREGAGDNQVAVP
jgi:peptidoglycan hydrolase-like protein with peptidoglycan-binding domain